MCCEVRLMYKIIQTEASIVILHAIRCIYCSAAMLLINVATGTRPRFVWNLKEMSSYRPRLKLEIPI